MYLTSLSSPNRDRLANVSFFALQYPTTSTFVLFCFFDLSKYVHVKVSGIYLSICAMGKASVFTQCQIIWSISININPAKRQKGNCLYLFFRVSEEDIKVSYSVQSHFLPVRQLSLSSNLFGFVMLITLGYLLWKLPPTPIFSAVVVAICDLPCPSMNILNENGINVKKDKKKREELIPLSVASKFNCVYAWRRTLALFKMNVLLLLQLYFVCCGLSESYVTQIKLDRSH